MTDHELPVHTGPDLLDMLDAAIETVEKVAPNLMDRAHPAGDLVIQERGGHFVMASLPSDTGRTGRCQHSVWAFLDMGSVLNVLTCAVHGNSIDPERARQLGRHLLTWADRAEARQ